MIYLCIPAHNEEQTVGVVLWKIRQVLTEFPRDYQLLVADDASTDRTAEVLAPYARVLPLTVLRARERRGYAASLEMLLREACRRSTYPKRDVIVTLQADFTDEPEDIVPLIKKVEQGADIVGGIRATDTRPPLLERWLLAWQRRLLQRVQWPDGCGDPLAGFRAYRVYTVKRALEEADASRLLAWDGPIADAELLRAVAPYSRRAESIDLAHRPDRRQRPTRASTWETLKRLRLYVRGAAPVATVPLAELSPETVPPPRPLDIARERRSEAAAEATAPRRNGRTSRGGSRATGGRTAGGNGRGSGRQRGGASGRQDGGRQEAGQSEDRPRRSRSQAAAGRGEGQERRGRSGGAARPERPAGSEPRRRKRSSARDDATGGTEDAAIERPVAPGVDAAGMESTAPAQDGAPPRRKRRRRRRKSSGTGAAPASSTAGPQDGADAAPGSQAGTTDSTRDTGGDADAGEAPDGAGPDGQPRKRRRRGGRRGGRGRRRGTPRAEGAEGAEGAASVDGGDEGSAPAGDAAPAPRGEGRAEAPAGRPGDAAPKRAEVGAVERNEDV